MTFICLFYCLIPQPRQALILSLQQRISEYQTEYLFRIILFWQINRLIHFTENLNLVVEDLYKVPFCFVTTLEVQSSHF